MEHVDTTATVKNSNLFFLIQPNKNPDLTITEITEHAEILKLPIAPASLKAQRITSLTFAYNSDFPATVRVKITKILRETLQLKVNYSDNELSIMGFKDRCMHFNAIEGQEFVIWFHKIVPAECVTKTLSLLRDIISDSEVATCFGLPKKPTMITKLFMIPDALGFFRDDIIHALSTANLSPAKLKLLIGRNHIGDCIANHMGTHGNVMLTFRDDIQLPESIQVNYPSSDTATSTMRLKVYTPRDYETSGGVPLTNNNNNNPYHKTALCHFFESDGKCRKGDQCDFAHGGAEMKIYKEKLKMRKNANVTPAGISLESLGVQHANLTVQDDVIMTPSTGNAGVSSTAIISEAAITTIITPAAKDPVLGLVENEDDRSFASSSSQLDEDEDHHDHDIVIIKSAPPASLPNIDKQVSFESTSKKNAMTFSTTLTNNGVPAPISAAATKPTITKQPTGVPTGAFSNTTPNNRVRPFSEITKTPPKDAVTSSTPTSLTPPFRHEGKFSRKK